MCPVSATEQLTVCMLIPEFSPSHGGTERQVEQLCRALHFQGITSFVLTGALKVSGNHLPDYSVPIYQVGSARSLHLGLAALWFLIRHRQEFQVIHVHTEYSPAIIAVLAGWLLQKPVVLKIRGIGLDGLDQFSGSAWRRWKFWILKRGVTRWIAISTTIQAELAHNGLECKSVFIPNGVDVAYVRPADEATRQAFRQEMELSTIGLVGVFVGSLHRLKRVEVLIRAWHQLHQEYRVVTLLIVGDGETKEDLQRLVSTHELEKQVKFVGRQSYAETVRFLQLSDVFILPSEAEGLSNALLEAMAAGRAVIASRTSGSIDIVHDGENGLLVDIGNVEQLANTLRRMASECDLRHKLGQAARSTIQRDYSIDSVASIYVDLYRGIAQLPGLRHISRGQAS